MGSVISGLFSLWCGWKAGTVTLTLVANTQWSDLSSVCLRQPMKTVPFYIVVVCVFSFCRSHGSGDHEFDLGYLAALGM